jgi:oligopeptide/dipeptide ABC transporter ATP-binding protein
MLLEIRDLSVQFATTGGPLHAVNGISFYVGEGEVLGVVGESGSGKSVTAHALLGLLPENADISAGEILYGGRSVAAMSSRELRRYRGSEVGMIFQEPGRSFDPIYSIGDTLRETILTHEPELSEVAVRERSLRLLEEVQVPYASERLGGYPHQFSGGLLQRIMIALALAANPKLLIADEPTTALDVTIQAQIIQLLLALKASRGLSIIFISHSLAVVGGAADRILVMYAGLVLENGGSAAVLGRPRHPYTRVLIDSHLAFGDHYSKNRLRAIGGTVPDPLHPEPGCPFAPRCPMVTARCRERVPEVSSEREDGREHLHRCIFPGVKEAGLA